MNNYAIVKMLCLKIRGGTNNRRKYVKVFKEFSLGSEGENIHKFKGMEYQKGISSLLCAFHPQIYAFRRENHREL